MLGQHDKFDMDLLSDFLDAKLKHCSQIEQKISVYSLVTVLSKSEHFVMYQTCEVRLYFHGEGVFFLKVIWLHLHYLAFGNKPKMPSVNPKIPKCSIFDLAFYVCTQMYKNIKEPANYAKDKIASIIQSLRAMCSSVCPALREGLCVGGLRKGSASVRHRQTGTPTRTHTHTHSTLNFCHSSYPTKWGVCKHLYCMK